MSNHIVKEHAEEAGLWLEVVENEDDGRTYSFEIRSGLDADPPIAELTLGFQATKRLFKRISASVSGDVDDPDELRQRK